MLDRIQDCLFFPALYFAGAEVTTLCILHINEAFYHAKTDYRNSAFITKATIMME